MNWEIKIKACASISTAICGSCLQLCLPGVQLSKRRQSPTRGHVGSGNQCPIYINEVETYAYTSGAAIAMEDPDYSDGSLLELCIASSVMYKCAYSNTTYCDHAFVVCYVNHDRLRYFGTTHDDVKVKDPLHVLGVLGTWC